MYPDKHQNHHKTLAMLLALFSLSLVLGACNQTPNIDLSTLKKLELTEPVKNVNGKCYNSATYEKDDIEIGFSQVEKGEQGKLVTLLKRGIMFNFDPIPSIKYIEINFNDLSSIRPEPNLYYGNHFLPTENVIHLTHKQNGVKIPDGNSFFVIQGNNMTNTLADVTVYYSDENVYEETKIPEVRITTENEKDITSQTVYTEGSLQVIDSTHPKNNLEEAKAKFRVRGNSTAYKIKKPYKIKFKDKQSLFGLEKAKSYCLLADFMDASKMHNYESLTFANYVRGEEFSPHPHHVNLFLNGQNLGLYLLCEHCDEKKGRLNLDDNNDILTAESLDDINIAIERDSSYKGRKGEDETYFISEQSFVTGSYKDKDGNETKDYNFYYSIDYPNKEDFYKKSETGKDVCDEKKFNWYLGELKTTFKSLRELFNDYKEGKDKYKEISDLVDVDSLASYALVDLFTHERDHDTRSFKMYKRAHGKWHIGPAWDYDALTFGIKFANAPVDYPYDKDAGKRSAFTSHFFEETWGNALLHDEENGFPLFKNLFKEFVTNDLNNFLNDIKNEISLIAPYLIDDTRQWYEENFRMVFDNLLWMQEYNLKKPEALEKYFKIA